MRAHQFSGSKTDLAMCCAYWARPDVVHPIRPMGAPAQRGITVHLASDCAHKGLPLPEFHDDTKALWESLRAWLATESAYTDSELPLLYDAESDTAAFGNTGTSDRDYLDVSAFKVPMRLDLVRVGDEVLHVLDLKTGSKSGTAPASENLQLATQALAAARYFGVGRVKVGLVFPLKTKVHPPEWHELDAEALDLHAGKLHRVLKQIPTSQPVRGSWCFRCPVGPSKGFTTDCPAWQIEEEDTRFEGAAQ